MRRQRNARVDGTLQPGRHGTKEGILELRRLLETGLRVLFFALPLVTIGAGSVWAGEPLDVAQKGNEGASSEKLTADQILKQAGDALFPEEFSAEIEMVQHKPGQPDVTSRMLLYKKDKNQVRSDYIYPPYQAGQKMLRKDGQIWMYMPESKRPVKLSPKQSLGGSNFNNGDIMRLNYEEDYTPSIKEETADHWVLELKAKDKTVTYDRIEYTVAKEGMKSIRQDFFALSGKQMKSLEFEEYKDYGGLLRPSLFVMRSSMNKDLYSELRYLKFENGKSLPSQEFRLEALAK